MKSFLMVDEYFSWSNNNVEQTPKVQFCENYNIPNFSSFRVFGKCSYSTADYYGIGNWTNISISIFMSLIKQFQSDKAPTYSGA